MIGLASCQRHEAVTNESTGNALPLLPHSEWIATLCGWDRLKADAGKRSGGWRPRRLRQGSTQKAQFPATGNASAAAALAEFQA